MCMNSNTPKLITTSDGSHSLFVEAWDESYHSIHGAIQESKHVFIEAGLNSPDLILEEEKTLEVLEMGFGTGLNAFLTYLAAKNKPIHYTSLEAYPIDLEMVQKLNYTKLLEVNEADTIIFEKMHQSNWNQTVSISSNFHLCKLNQQLEEANLPSNHFHLVYYDAFAPSAQPELWTEAIFSKLYRSMRSGGILTTYCAKGVVKRILKKVGFEVRPLPGPPGKREMTKAIKMS